MMTDGGSYRVGVWEFCVLHTLWTFCFFWMKEIATCYCHLSFLLQLFVKAFANFRKWQRAVLFSAWATGPCGLRCRGFYLRTSEWGDIMVSVRVRKCRGALPAFSVFILPIRFNNTCFSRLPSSYGRRRLRLIFWHANKILVTWHTFRNEPPTNCRHLSRV